MITCRLSTILGAKRLKVSDVCHATGIARATVDRYYYDKVNSFDREVLAKLCKFLKVKPGELLVLVDQQDLFDPYTVVENSYPPSSPSTSYVIKEPK